MGSNYGAGTGAIFKFTKFALLPKQKWKSRVPLDLIVELRPPMLLKFSPINGYVFRMLATLAA